MSERDAFKKLLEDFNKIEDSVGKNDIEVEVASPIKVRLLAELKARQLKDPKTEVMVVKNDKVIVIDKKDLPKYVDDGWALAEAHGGKHTTTGRSMTKGEEKEKERLVKGMKKNKADFKKRYGKDADAVMYATATKKAMEDDDGNPYRHNGGEDQVALVNSVLWRMKDIYLTYKETGEVHEDDLFGFGSEEQWVDGIEESRGMIYQSYDKFLQYVNDAVNKAGKFKGQSDSLEVDLDLNIMKKLFDDFKTAASKKLKGQGIKEGQVMSFEQMDKIYSGLKNAIDLYEKLVGDIEDPMADFTDDLGSDIVNYTKQGPLSSAPEIKNIENLSQSQMLTLASMARQAIGLAQSDVGANVTDIPAAEEFVKKLDVAIKRKTAMEGALNVDRDTMSNSIGDMVETFVKRAPIEEINKILQFIKANKKVSPSKDGDRVIMTTEDGHTDTDSMQAKTAQIAKDAIELYQMFKNNPGDEEIMTWITNKLAVAAEKISSVKDYLQNPTQDEMTEFKKVEIKNKEDYMAKKKELQRLQMDPDTNKNEKLKKEIIKRKADLEDEAKKMGMKEDANTLKRLKDEVEDFMGQINNMEFGDLNPTRLADELNEILNGTYDPSTDPVNNPEDNDEDYIREQVAMAIELLEKGGIMPAMQMLNKAIGDTHGVEFGKDFPKEDELTLRDDADFHETFGVLAYPTDEIWEAEYRGRKVKLNKPTRGDVKKFKVYVKDPKTGNIKKVNFGHGGTSAKRKTMRIRKSDPARRRSFRARHNCDNPGPKTKARYWSCRNW